MPRWLYDRIAREVFPRARYVCLSLMAEPLMTRDLPSRLDTLRSFDVPFTEMTTNATILTAALAAQLACSGLSRINVSIDDCTKEGFEHARPGARFERVVDHWHLLREACSSETAPRLRINHVLTPFNIERFDDFLRFAESLGADELSIRTVTRMGASEVQESTDPDFWRQVHEVREKLFSFSDRTGIEDTGYLRHTPGVIEIRGDDGERLTCRNPWTTLAIHANGDAYPCYAWTRPRIGTFVEMTFEEIRSGAALIAIRDEFDRIRPGVDCTHCMMRRREPHQDDDCFYEIVTATPAPDRPPCSA